MNILMLLLFWICIISYMYLIEDKLNIKRTISLPITFSLITIITFISALINILYISSLSIYVLGIILFIKYYKKIFQDFKQIKKNELVIISIFVLITILGSILHITHYDNFSHWALIVKNIFDLNALPGDGSNITFKGYQPGSALFIYFVGLFTNRSESIMIIAHNYLLFSLFIPFIKLSKNIKEIIISVLFYLFILLCSYNGFNNLLVDTIISMSIINSFMIIYENKDDISNAFIPLLIISIFMSLIKNVGIGFALLNALIFLYISYKNKKFKKNLKYILILFGSIILTVILWYIHVYLVFGSNGMASKHSLSNASIHNLGLVNIIAFIKIYLKNFISYKNITFYILILLNILYRKNKKFILSIDLLYILYTGFLSLMYILSMPWEEARILAGYERYMMIILNTILGSMLLYNFKNNDKFKNIIICSILIIFIGYNYRGLPLFIGHDEYKDSVVEKYDLILKDNKLNKDENFYIYAPVSKDNTGFLYNLSIYKLNSVNINIIIDINDIDDIEHGYVIIFDDMGKIINLKQIDNNIYYKKRV